MAVATGTALLGAGALGVGASIYGASRAAKAQRRATRSAERLQREAMERQIELNEPFRQSGLDALDAIASIFGLPGVEGVDAGDGFSLSHLADLEPVRFIREQGEQAIERAQNRAGMRGSGRELFDLIGFNQGLASTAVKDFALNPLFQLAGLGPSASQATSGAIGTGAANLSNLAIQSGQNRASTIANINQGVQGGLTNLSTLLAMQNAGQINSPLLSNLVNPNG